MKRVLVILVSLLFIIIGLSGCHKSTATNSNNISVSTQQTEELNKSIKDLINKSLDIQYGTSSIELTEGFSNSFIEKIKDTSNFYKKELKPYKIISINYDEIKDKSIDNFIVYVRLNDTKGEYTQVVHLIKKNGSFIVDEIEYDI
jgi:hypothetical protein